MTEDQASYHTVAEVNGHLTDVQALTEILSVFAKVNPETRQRLLQTVITFFGANETLGGDRESQAYSITPSTSFSVDRTISPKEFLLDKRPKTDVERVACLAYYLTHYRSTPHFKTIDLSKLNTEAAQAKFSNAATAVDNATSGGYLIPVTRGNKQLSAAGEVFVQNLPDRDAARAAMASAHLRRKYKKQSPDKQSQEDEE
jgi:hypothetical protein